MARQHEIEYLREEVRRLRAELEFERQRSAERAAVVEAQAAPAGTGQASDDLIAKIAAVIDGRIAVALGTIPSVPGEAREAHSARYAARLRGYFLVKEFAAVIGRHDQYVSDRCRDGRIATLRGGKPYRIPLSEGETWNKLAN